MIVNEIRRSQMKTVKRILQVVVGVIMVYALHLMIEAVVVTNVVAYFGYSMPIFV
jgi:hypothetical protein